MAQALPAQTAQPAEIGMDLGEARAWLALRLAPGMTTGRLASLVARFGPKPGKLLGLAAAQVESMRGFDADAARSILEGASSRGVKAAVEQEIELLLARRARLVVLGGEDYPANLSQSTLPPPLLYVRGRLEREADRYSIALVGSRQATTYGRMIAATFSEQFARAGLTVVSGFARGIDGAAHRAALSVAGGRTIAVLGSGLAVAYPAEHGGLGNEIAGGGDKAALGAIISEYPMAAQPERFHFPERNRLIAALSLGTIVVEAAERSGALITARLALEESRFVFAVPGDVTRQTSRGANALIREGAIVAQSAADVLGEMSDVLKGYLKEERSAVNGVDSPATTAGAKREDSAKPMANSASAPPGIVLSEDERAVLGVVRREPSHVDLIAAQLDPAQIPISRLSGLLLGLELKGLIHQMPGRVYAAF